MKEVQFPKLKWPLKTKYMSDSNRLIYCAYDIIWRMLYTDATNLTEEQQIDLACDIEANLQNLGGHIEKTMEASSLFEPESLELFNNN